jgi:thiosulfate dehydrogenase (quinone) large subunit
MSDKKKYRDLSLIFLRILTGWHFLHEGISKLLNQNWSSFDYLMESKGFISSIYHSIAVNHNLLAIIDFLNVWGLILIGTGLLLGLFTRLSCIAGIVLLLFYYLGTIPLPGLVYNIPTEGNYLIVNKILIELAVLIVLLTHPTQYKIGLDKWLNKKKL